METLVHFQDRQERVLHVRDGLRDGLALGWVELDVADRLGEGPQDVGHQAETVGVQPLLLLDLPLEYLSGVLRRLLGVEHQLTLGELRALIRARLLLVGGAFVVVRKQGSGGEQPLLVETFLVVADPLVQLLASIGVDHPVADLRDLLAQEVHDLVVDLEVQADQPERLCAVEELEDPVLVDLGRSGEHADGDVLTQGRGALEDVTALFVEGRDLLHHDLFQRARQVSVLQRLDHPRLSLQ